MMNKICPRYQKDSVGIFCCLKLQLGYIQLSSKKREVHHVYR